MKMSVFPKAIFAATAVFFAGLSNHTSAHASGGSMAGGGGDRCEERFKDVAKDLESWLRAGGAKGLALGNPRGEIAPAKYTADMLASLANFRITCVSPGDAGYPVVVGGQAKECVNKRDSSSEMGWIVCDRAKFYSGLKSPENDPSQYMIVHHEFATLAGFEIPNQGDSQYWISSQITGFLESQSIQKLVVRASSPNAARIGTIKLPNQPFLSFALRPDRRHLAYATDGTRIHILDLATHGETTFALRQGSSSDLPWFDYSPNGSLLLLTNRQLGNDFYSISVYDTAGDMKLALDNLYASSFLPDSQNVVTVDANATLAIRRIRDGQVLRKFNEPRLLEDGPFDTTSGPRTLTKLQVSPNGRAVVAELYRKNAEWDKQITAYLIDLQSGEVKGRFQGPSTAHPIYGFTIDGTKAVVRGPRPVPNGDRWLEIIDIASGRKVDSVKILGTPDYPTAVQWLPDGRIFAQYYEYDFARILDPKTGYTLLKQIPSTKFREPALDPTGTLALGETGQTNLVATSLKNGHVQILWQPDGTAAFTEILYKSSHVLSSDRALIITKDGNPRPQGTDINIRIVPIPPM